MNTLAYYRKHSALSDPGRFAMELMDVPANIDAVVNAVRGVMLHDYFGARLYSEPPADVSSASRATLPIEERLSTFQDFPRSPLTRPRHSRQKRIGTCRDFALLTCAVLRQHMIPARVRCGFALYFHPPTYEDHWICEFWDSTRDAWRLVDAQLDDAHRTHLGIDFDPTEVPNHSFLFPWQVWVGCARDPQKLENFGHGEAKGLWFVRVNLARDVLALCKIERSEWDTWRDQSTRDKLSNEAALKHCQDLAAISKELSLASHVQLDALEITREGLRVPHWQSTSHARSD